MSFAVRHTTRSVIYPYASLAVRMSPDSLSYGVNTFFVAPTPDYYVSNAGSDTNAGTLAAPFATLAKAITVLANGKTIALARGSMWRESIDCDLFTGVTVMGYGNIALPMPHLNGTNIITTGMWTKTAGKTNVYQFTLAHTVNNGYASVWENGVQMTPVADTTACDATPGSHVVSGYLSVAGSVVMYINASSGIPTTNGKFYEASCRFMNVRANTIIDIWGSRPAQNDGAAFGNSLIRCLGVEGSKHNLFAFKSGDMRDCVAYRSGSPATGAGGGSQFVWFAAGAPTKRGTLTNCYAYSDRPPADSQLYSGVLSHGGSLTDIMGGFDCNGYYAYNLVQAFTVGDCLDKTIQNVFLERCTVGFNDSSATTYENVKWLVDSVDGAPPSGNTALFNGAAVITGNNIAIYAVSTTGQGVWYDPANGSKLTQMSAYSPGGAYKFFLYGATDGRSVEISRSVTFGIDRLSYLPTANSDFVNNTDNVFYTPGNNLSVFTKGTEYTSLSAYKTARPTLDQNSIGSNPLFTTVPSAGDFTLSASSPANTTFAKPVGYQGVLARPDWAGLRAKWDAGFLGIDGTGTGVSTAGVLDGLSAVVLGTWGLRKQRLQYNGAAIQVRRSSDNATTLIYFINGVVDTATLLAFCGSASGYVIKIFDQKGSAHLSQLTDATQPRIVNAGTLETKNGKPTITSNATQFMFTGSSEIVIPGNAVSLNAVTANDGISGPDRTLPSFIENGTTNDAFGSGAIFGGEATAANRFQGYRGSALGYQSFTANALVSVNSIFDGTNHNMYVNNVVGTSAAAAQGFATSGGLVLNNSRTFAPAYPAKAFVCFSEFTLFGAALGSSDRTALTANQTAFYGL